MTRSPRNCREVREIGSELFVNLLIKNFLGSNLIESVLQTCFFLNLFFFHLKRVSSKVFQVRIHENSNRSFFKFFSENRRMQASKIFYSLFINSICFRTFLRPSTPHKSVIRAGIDYHAKNVDAKARVRQLVNEQRRKTRSQDLANVSSKKANLVTRRSVLENKKRNSRKRSLTSDVTGKRLSQK